MNLLLHICCACCLCAPLNELRKEGFEVTGLFYNPNIHPFLEFRRRLKALRVFQESDPIPVIYYEEYGIREYLKNVDYEGDDRCADCYALRLKFTADYAKKNGFDAFTSTMLFSVYQKHEQLKMISENLSREHEVDFVYRDYRPLSECSHNIARKKMIYRQGYCGCVFSEYERYKDTTRELYKGNSPYNKENSRKILGTEKELQRCDCFG
ncbi:MAG: epoxyqueuosine reductase QueH [Planctomycetes bacterium]|uniref:epoxyqueuosine reductase QueH n=1 Tax=Candidatus Wunengus sp. YC65 TaxID=3367701 RepID=UPI001DD08F9C|nr:epoxyqueuosine reductase QueH [Planctomycetota bacterium]